MDNVIRFQTIVNDRLYDCRALQQKARHHFQIDCIVGTVCFRGYANTITGEIFAPTDYYSTRYKQWLPDDVSRDWQYHAFRAICENFVNEKILR